MKTLVIFVLTIGLVTVLACRPESTPVAEKAAVTAAEDWLKLIDDGDYAQSWKRAASYFKNVIPEETWIQKMEAVRKPLGRTLSRKLKSATYRTELPGAPDGEYVIIQFDTSFENKKAAVETVTPMLEDGVWAISGYYIK